MEKMTDLKALLTHEVEDLYSAEEQIIDALPAMIDKAKNKSLKDALNEHLRITEEQKNRLDEVKSKLKGEEHQESENEKGEKKTGFLSSLFGGGTKVCKGMQGIIDEGKKVMDEDMDEDVMDAAIIACAQKVEHYEICGYGTARAYAEELNLQEVEKLLKQTLNEEYQADDKLTELAVGRLNREAQEPGLQTKNQKSKTKKTSSASSSKNSSGKKSSTSKSSKSSASKSAGKSSSQEKSGSSKSSTKV